MFSGQTFADMDPIGGSLFVDRRLAGLSEQFRAINGSYRLATVSRQVLHTCGWYCMLSKEYNTPPSPFCTLPGCSDLAPS
jgi:hypothetical protein